MDQVILVSLRGLVIALGVFIGSAAAWSWAKYLIWRSGACVPGIISCK
ncbi:MAG TPA: hypothetical protein VK463_08790 [Desulfomonilaceae bacterium]|nr:hypothetical protein [Desulfomonilaceae bacterium]